MRLLPAQVVWRLPLPLRLRGLPRCSLCPLFDAERAIRDVLGENPPAALVFEIRLGPALRALLGEVPSDLVEGSDLDSEVPDFVPEGADPRGDEPAG